MAKEKSLKIGGENVVLDVLRLALPSILSMLVVSLYSVCDIYFLSAVGKTAVGGVCYPATAVLVGIAMTFAFGSANKISASLGKGEKGIASGYFCSGLFSGGVFCVLVGCVVGIFASDIVNFCSGGNAGGDGGYLAVSGFSLLLFYIYFYYSACLRGVGKAKIVAIASVVGLACNWIFDFVAVYFFQSGAVGIAIATAVAQLVAGGFMVVYSSFKVDIFRPSMAFFDIFSTFEIILLGSSSFFRQLMCGVSAITLNYICGLLGGETLAGATIASKVSVLLFSFGLGLGQGMQPILAFHFGGGKNQLARKTLICTIAMGIILSVVVGGVQFVFADKIATIFCMGNSQSGEIARKILQISAFSTTFAFTLVIINMAFQGVNSKIANAVIASLRQGVIFVPTIIILAWQFGKAGMIVSHFTADVIAGIISIFFLRHLLKNKLR